MVLYDGSGNCFLGLLELAFIAVARWDTGMRYLGIILNVEQTMNKPEDYDYYTITFLHCA